MLQRPAPRRNPLHASLLFILFALAFAPNAFAQDGSQGVTPGALSAFGAADRVNVERQFPHVSIVHKPFAADDIRDLVGAISASSPRA